MPFSFLPSHALDGALDGPRLHVAKGARRQFLLGVRLNPMTHEHLTSSPILTRPRLPLFFDLMFTFTRVVCFALAVHRAAARARSPCSVSSWATARMKAGGYPRQTT